MEEQRGNESTSSYNGTSRPFASNSYKNVHKIYNQATQPRPLYQLPPKSVPDSSLSLPGPPPSTILESTRISILLHLKVFSH